MRAILTYHSVDPSGSPISISEDAFRAHVAWLSAAPVRVVPLAQLAAEAAPDDTVALTFDDGFASFADVAWPLLRANGLPATVFVVTGHVGRMNDWGARATAGRRNSDVPALPLMDWDTLGRLAGEGVEIGAHTRTHSDLRRATDAELVDELDGGAMDIAARTGARPSAFAYPYGAVNARVAAATASRYPVAVTTRMRGLRDREHPALLPRLDTFYLRDAGRLESWGTKPFHRRLRLRAGLRRVRSILTGTPS